jgi:hypothetical protein
MQGAGCVEGCSGGGGGAATAGRQAGMAEPSPHMSASRKRLRTKMVLPPIQRQLPALGR